MIASNLPHNCIVSNIVNCHVFVIELYLIEDCVEDFLSLGVSHINNNNNKT